MDQSGKYITQEKREALEAELAELRGPKRKEILDALKYAKSLGDLSENAEYHQAREEQGKLEERIAKIKQVLQSSETIKGGGGGDVIEIGSKVVVQKIEDGNTPSSKTEKQNYVIVGGEEADMRMGKISNFSPFGKALFGKKKGDKVSFKTPKGMVDYKIIDVA